ncbi:MAG: polyhydroxyalkanoate synthesis regulator DNA-binding domain-containing protein [Acidobacteriaceae bacterium]
MNQPDMAQKTVVIKKYENRRLYDTTNSRYVNLEEVAQILQQGNDVQVIDAATGDDITRLILTQIIVEDAKTPESDFPLDLLRQMVVASGRATQESALNYMKAMLDLYQSTYRAVAPQLNPFDFMQYVQSNRGMPGNEPVPPPTEKPAESTRPDASPADSEEVKELKTRLAELEKLVSKLVPTKSKK